MKIALLILSVFLSVSFFGFGQSEFAYDLKKANDLYDSKKREEARQWYEIAAEKGSADANFYLAYRYVNSDEKTKKYFAKAALLGHPKALDYALDYMFFRASDLLDVNPIEALELYRRVKSSYPGMTIYNEESTVKTLEIAASIPWFDAEEFIEKYNLKADEDYGYGYYIWELAAAASRGERFENPSSELVMQLIVRGGFVPAEVEGAIQDYYSRMIRTEGLVEFSVCDYVTSGIGMGYCARKYEAEEQKRILVQIEEMKDSFGLKNSLLDTAYISAMRFLDSKVWNEEGHDGSGYMAWAQGSLSEQRKSYLEFLSDINSGTIPVISGSLKDNDSLLNINYKELFQGLEKDPINGGRFTIDADGFRETQRLWLKYRDTNTELLTVVSNQKDKDFWNNYFIKQRLEQFEQLKERIRLEKY